VAKTKSVGGRKQRAISKSRAMPKFTKPPAALVDTFTREIGKLPGVQRRQMFGYPAAFTNSQMFASLFQDEMILRLSDVDRRVLGEKGGQPFEPMPGRPMREYMTVPEPIRESASELRTWLTKAQIYAASLPPKKRR
jgi:TfoX/Sxy family transcriptional regulator of competence genes